MGDDSVCFLCKDGGTLVLCDHKKCNLGYHAECLGRDLEFFKRGKWHCGRHFCSICSKVSSNYCAMCPASFCSPCLSQMDISVVEYLPLEYISEPPQPEYHAGEYGLCEACHRVVKMIELKHSRDENGKKIDFDDSTTVEFLFKEYWTLMKLKYGLKPPSFPSDSHVSKHVPDPHPIVANSLQKEQVSRADELLLFSRSQLLELLDDPFKFTAAVVDGFVRVRVINKEGSSYHRLVQITGTVLQSEYYEVGKKKTNVLIDVLNVNRRERIKINLVSDHLSTEEGIASGRDDARHPTVRRKESGINRSRENEQQAAGGDKKLRIDKTCHTDQNALERVKKEPFINKIHGSPNEGTTCKQIVFARSKQNGKENISSICCSGQEYHGDCEKDLQDYRNKETRITNTMERHHTDTGTSEWYYKDLKDDEHGPFSMEDLRNWSKQGIFPQHFRIWRCGEPSILLTEALKADSSFKRSDFEGKFWRFVWSEWAAAPR